MREVGFGEVGDANGTLRGIFIIRQHVRFAIVEHLAGSEHHLLRSGNRLEERLVFGVRRFEHRVRLVERFRELGKLDVVHNRPRAGCSQVVNHLGVQ